MESQRIVSFLIFDDDDMWTVNVEFYSEPEDIISYSIMLAYLTVQQAKVASEDATD